MYSGKKSGSYRSAYLDRMLAPAPKAVVYRPKPEELYAVAKLNEEERTEARAIARETSRYLHLRKKSTTERLSAEESAELSNLSMTVNGTYGAPDSLRNTVRRKLHAAMAELVVTHGS